MNNSLRVENIYPCLRKYLGYKVLIRLSTDFPCSVLAKLELTLVEASLDNYSVQEFVDSLFD